MSWKLEIRSGTRRGETLELTGEYITIGLAKDNTLRFTDSTVSDHHAMLTGEGDAYKLWDLHSTHGTHVNGERIVVKILKDGDAVRLGAVEFRCKLSKPEPPSKPQTDVAPAVEKAEEPARAAEKEHASGASSPVVVLGASARAPDRVTSEMKESAVAKSAAPSDNQPVPSRTDGKLRSAMVYMAVLLVGLGIFFGGYPLDANAMKFFGLVMIAVALVSLLFVAMFGGVVESEKKEV